MYRQLRIALITILVIIQCMLMGTASADDKQAYCFVDAAVEVAVCETLNKPAGTITQADLKTITGLDLYDSGAADLQDIAKMENLQYLLLSFCDIEDITPLGGLSALEYLWIDHCPVSDISPLKNLDRLRYLNMDSTDIWEVETLSNLKALEWLSVGNTYIVDLSMLPNLSTMEVYPEALKEGLPELSQENYMHYSRGANGEDVKAIQRQLIHLGYLNDNIDGVYGANTERAIAEFQQVNNVYGAFGVATNFTQKRLFGPDAVAKGVSYDRRIESSPVKIAISECTNQNDEKLWITFERDPWTDLSVVWLELSFVGIDENGKELYDDNFHYVTRELATSQYWETIRIDYPPYIEEMSKIYLKITAAMYQDGSIMHWCISEDGGLDQYDYSFDV